MDGTGCLRARAGSSPPLSPTAARNAGAADSYPDQLSDPMLTLQALPEWYQLAVTCGHCRHLAPLDRWELARKVGKQTVIASLVPKLRCAKCGKGDVEGHLIMLVEHGIPIANPTDIRGDLLGIQVPEQDSCEGSAQEDLPR